MLKWWISNMLHQSDDKCYWGILYRSDDKNKYDECLFLEWGLGRGEERTHINSYQYSEIGPRRVAKNRHYDSGNYLNAVYIVCSRKVNIVAVCQTLVYNIITCRYQHIDIQTPERLTLCEKYWIIRLHMDKNHLNFRTVYVVVKVPRKLN